ncbi:MAG: ribonuclease H-like domain-containing protein [Candidatus Staskawiczbacteria bacterium]|nr:ribonuclease H-like domain-containing protein [Candidatus Staskawiczbacteria bacterium]
MYTCIFDIETIGESFDAMDEQTQKALTHWIEKDEALDEKEKQGKIKEVKDRLGLSPLTGEIVSICVLDYEKQKGVTYFQAGNKAIEPFSENGIEYKPMSELDMLKKFWEGTGLYQNFVTFNGGSFDVPYIMIRSAIHKIKPTKNMMSNRYLKSQDFGAKHIDLLEQLTFYGAVRRTGMSLHMACRAFGITSSKEGEIDGSEVGELFKQERYEDIARYNTADVRATGELYRYWNEYLNFDYRP